MGSGPSKNLIIKTTKNKIVAISNIYHFAENLLPKQVGFTSAYLIQSAPNKISFYVRCPDHKAELVMHAMKKPNKNYRIFNKLNKPIGWLKNDGPLKHSRGTYQLYAKKGKKKSRGIIEFVKTATKRVKTHIHIPGHVMFESALFMNPNPGRQRIKKSHKNTNIVDGNKLIWSLVKIDQNQFRLDCRYPFSWLQAFGFGVVAMDR